MGYVLRDVTMAAVLGWAALTYIPQIPNALLRGVAWMAYGYAQGLVCTGIWILAHEAGHGAFSVHRRFNDFVGWVLHSSLLVPYFSWKFSHHRHHRFTGHMEKDMAFVPQTKDAQGRPGLKTLYLDPEVFEDAPIVQLVQLLGHQLFGWQLYLFFNVSAGVKSKQREEPNWWRMSHFEPRSAVFRLNEAVYIALSDLGIGLTLTALYFASTAIGWPAVFLLYIVPYFWVHHWLGIVSPRPSILRPAILTCFSCNYIPTPHPPRCSSLYSRGLDFCQGRFGNRGQRLWLGWTFSVPRNH